MASAELPRFAPAPDELAKIEKLLHHETGSHPPLILLNPNSSDLLPLRRWPTERYVELARLLLDKYPEIFVAFVGAPAEAAAASELVSSGCLQPLHFTGRQNHIAATAYTLHIGRGAGDQR